MTDHDPPNDIAAEQALIGAILTDPTELPGLTIQPADFWRPNHETIWAAIQTLNGVPDYPLGLLDALTRTGDLQRVGGGVYLQECMASWGSGSPAWYAERITRLAVVRRAQQAFTQLAQRVDHLDPDSPYEALEDAQRALETAYNDLLSIGTGRTTPKTSSWAAQDLTPVLAGGELDPPPTLMPRTDGHHLIYAGAVHSFAGEPGSGKTWLALTAAADELANGRDVLFIDFEDRASRVVGRLLGLGATPTDIGNHFKYSRPHNALDDQARDALAATLRRTNLVIVDGVTEALVLHGLGYDNEDVAAFYALLPRWIADHGPAVILIDHVAKDPETQGRWSIGGQHKLAGLDGVGYIIKTVETFGRGKRGTSKVVISKDRPGFVEEIAVGRVAAEFTLDATNPDQLTYTLNSPTPIPTDQAGTPRYTILMGRISTFLAVNPGATGKTIEDAKLGKAVYVRDALATLIREGYVEIEKGQRGARHHHNLKLYTPDDEPGA